MQAKVYLYLYLFSMGWLAFNAGNAFGYNSDIYWYDDYILEFNNTVPNNATVTDPANGGHQNFVSPFSFLISSFFAFVFAL